MSVLFAFITMFLGVFRVGSDALCVHLMFARRMMGIFWVIGFTSTIWLGQQAKASAASKANRILLQCTPALVSQLLPFTTLTHCIVMVTRGIFIVYYFYYYYYYFYYWICLCCSFSSPKTCQTLYLHIKPILRIAKYRTRLSKSLYGWLVLLHTE